MELRTRCITVCLREKYAVSTVEKKITFVISPIVEAAKRKSKNPQTIVAAILVN